jgi:hypothetical protein
MLIRKISIGPDYKSGMHYLLGQEVLGGNYKIHLIKIEEKSNSIQIWIERNDEIMLWKHFSYTMPLSVEYNINF